MTRIAIRHTLLALATLALASAFASGPAAAQTQIDPPSLQLSAGPANTTADPKSTKGLATRNPSRQTTTHYQFRWWYDYGGGK